MCHVEHVGRSGGYARGTANRCRRDKVVRAVVAMQDTSQTRSISQELTVNECESFRINMTACGKRKESFLKK